MKASQDALDDSHYIRIQIDSLLARSLYNPEVKNGQELEGSIAIVTGASSGIGRATSLALRAHGARVILFARREQVLADLTGDDERLLGVPGDVTSTQDLDDLFRECDSRFGRLDILINNAGFVEPATLEDLDMDLWRRHQAINVEGPLACIQRAVPLMKKAGGGSIVNVASISGVQGPSKFPGFAAYAASKAALIMLTEALAAELTGSGIRINAVSPGSVATPMFESVAPGVEADMTPDEVAATIVHLCTPESRPINGQNIHVFSS